MPQALGGAGPHRLSDRGRPRARARSPADGAPAAAALDRPDAISRFERVLVWCHWVWFVVPHASVGYVAAAPPERFAVRRRADVRGVRPRCGLLLGDPDCAALVRGAPRAPRRRSDRSAVRRMMIEYGEQFWGDRWPDLYDVLGGNPLAAMPSLHFATSLMAAHLLSEVGPGRRAPSAGPTRSTLGLALVYLGEHYAADLLAGGAAGRGGARCPRRDSRPSPARAGCAARVAHRGRLIRVGRGTDERPRLTPTSTRPAADPRALHRPALSAEAETHVRRCRGMRLTPPRPRLRRAVRRLMRRVLYFVLPEAARA